MLETLQGMDKLLQCLRKSAVIAIEGSGTTTIELIAENRNLVISYIQDVH